jgi:hypothetical protein
MLNSKQRAQLRALGNGLDAVFQIGKGGINDQLIRQIDELLELKELVKLRVLPQCPLSSREAADKVAELVGADVVQVIGSRFILYKESRENKKIILVR